MGYKKFFDLLKEKVVCGKNTWHPSPNCDNNSFAGRRHFAFDENIRISRKGRRVTFNPHIYVYAGKTTLFDGKVNVFEEKARAAFEAARAFLKEGATFEKYFKSGGKTDNEGHLYGTIAQLSVPISSDNYDVLSQQEKDEIVRAYKVLVDAEIAIGVRDEDFNKKAQGGSKVTENNVLSHNLIVFGAPGTGKSHYLEDLRLITWKDVQDSDKEGPYYDRYERVTFYPTYSYAQFVGSYKPVMKDVNKDGFEPKNGEPTRKAIAYEFVPGPFLRILKDALRNEDKNYLLIIEEINRANAAAVFGDVFQLLDRKNEDDDEAPKGWSEYSITPNREMIEYLMDKDEEGKGGVSKDDAEELRIPSNFYIWATMNSADQGVFPLDTAFKRRWDFEYMPLDPRVKDKEQRGMDEADVYIGDNCKCTWGKIRRAINSLLKRNQVNEDKLLSFSFVRSDKDGVISSNRFKMKVLMYLWEDAARMCRKSVFAEGLGTFSDLMEEWDGVAYKEGDDGLLKALFRFDDSKEERLELTQRDEAELNVDAGNADTGTGEAQPAGGGDAETGDAVTADAGTGAEPAADAGTGDAVTAATPATEPAQAAPPAEIDTSDDDQKPDA